MMVLVEGQPQQKHNRYGTLSCVYLNVKLSESRNQIVGLKAAGRKTQRETDRQTIYS